MHFFEKKLSVFIQIDTSKKCDSEIWTHDLIFTSQPLPLHAGRASRQKKSRAPQDQDLLIQAQGSRNVFAPCAQVLSYSPASVLEQL